MNLSLLYTVGVQSVDQANVASAFSSIGLSISTKFDNALSPKVDQKCILILKVNLAVFNK